MQALQIRTWFDAEFIVEGGPGTLVGLQRLGLAPGSVQRQHELGMQALPVRVIQEQCTEAADELRVAPEGKVGLDLLLQYRQPSLFQPRDGPPGERLRCQIGQRLSPPQRERLAKQRGCRRRIAGQRSVPLGGQALEPHDVDISRIGG